MATHHRLVNKDSNEKNIILKMATCSTKVEYVSQTMMTSGAKFFLNVMIVQVLDTQEFRRLMYF